MFAVFCDMVPHTVLDLLAMYRATRVCRLSYVHEAIEAITYVRMGMVHGPWDGHNYYNVWVGCSFLTNFKGVLWVLVF